MKYTLLVLLTEDNDNYRTQLEERISDLECIEEIRYLHITDSVDLKKRAETENYNIKVSVKISFSGLTGGTLTSKIQKEVKDLEGRYCMILPQSMLPSKKFFQYAANVPDESTGVLILGLHDNKVVGKDCLQSAEDNYTIYTVYNKQPSENDFENCVLCKAELLNSIPHALNGHFSVSALYQTILRDGKKAAYAVNERLCFDRKTGNSFTDKKIYSKDLKTAKRKGIVPSQKMSFLEKLFSIKKFNGRTLYTFLGQTVSVKVKKIPKFPSNAVEVEEKVRDLKKLTDLDLKNSRACLFASFTKDGLVSNNTLDYLKSLREYCDVIVYVADSKALPLTVEKLKKLCDCVIVKRHKEYDFGSYKRGYQYLSDSHLLEKIDSLLICNDSVDFVGNSEDLKEIFTKAKADDAYALCMATYGFGKKIKKHRYEWAKNPHLQSYFMVLDKKVFTAEYFKKFMSGIKRIKSKTEIIKKYEMGLSEMLREKNVKMGSFYPYDDTNIVNPYAIYLNQFVKRPVFVKHMLSK